MKSLLICVLIQIPVFAVEAGNKLLNDSLPPGPNYQVAAFRLWYNDPVSVIRGTIVLVPGSNSDGRDMTEDPEWQRLAEKYHFALMGCYFTDRPHENMAIEEYADVSRGSGEALLRALSDFALKSGHTELAVTPLLLWGMSAGGEFNYEFACWKPERTIAFVVNKGGIYYTNLASPETRSVPALFFAGADDMAFRTEVVRGIFSANRRFGALWTYTEEPGTKHEFENSKKMTEIFFDEIIPMRLPKTGNADLKKLSEINGLTGDLKTFRVTNGGPASNSGYPTSWLLNKRVADAWNKIARGIALH